MLKNTLGEFFKDDKAKAEFVKLSAQQQLEKFKEVVGKDPNPLYKKVDEKQLAAFILLFQLKIKTVAAGSKEHYAMRDTLGLPLKGWHKDNPPTNIFDMTNNQRVPCWLEDYGKIGEAVALLDFNAAHNNNDIADAIKTVLGIGGLEDTGDTRAITEKDPTMSVFVAAAQYQLPLAYPTWVVNGKLANKEKELPQGTDLRAKFVIEAELEQIKQAKKAQAKKEAVEATKAQKKAEYETQKAKFFALLQSCPEAEALAKSMSEKTFQEARKTTEVPNGETWLTEPVLKFIAMNTKKAEGMDDKAYERATMENISLTKQYVLEKLGKLQPTWVRQDARSWQAGLYIPKNLPTENTTARAQRNGLAVSRRHIAGLMIQYSVLDVAAAMLEVLGVQKPLAEVYGVLPEKPQAGMELLLEKEKPKEQEAAKA